MRIEITKDDLGFLPKNIKNLLGKLSDLSEDSEDDEVIFNFEKSDTNELSNTIIWMILKETKLRKNKIKIKYKGSTKSYFDERHFFDNFTGKKSSFFSQNVPIHYETFTPIRPSSDNNQNDAIDSTLTEVTKNILLSNNKIHKEIKMQIVECINNAFDHSDSKAEVPAGIICTLKMNKYLDFCIADMGQGIKKAFLDNPLLQDKYINLEEWDIIAKATDKNISCNPEDARNDKYTTPNGGLGLYWLREFVKCHNECKLIIISGKGYYRQMSNKKIANTSNLGIKWPGAIVFFTININQEESEEYIKIVGQQFLDDFENKQFITLK